MLEALVRSITSLEAEVKVLSKIVRKNGKTIEAQMQIIEDVDFPAVLPVQTEEEMKILEDVLEDKVNRKLLVSKLARIGGARQNSVINSALDAVFGKKIQANITPCGQQGKKSLQATRVYPVLLEAIRCSEHCKTLTDSVIRQNMGIKLASAGHSFRKQMKAVEHDAAEESAE